MKPAIEHHSFPLVGNCSLRTEHLERMLEVSGGAWLLINCSCHANQWTIIYSDGILFGRCRACGDRTLSVEVAP